MNDTRRTPPHMRYWHVAVSISESGDRTQARAVLRVEPAREIEGTGRSSRSRRDPTSPAIGDEVAVARALRALSDRLLEAAAGDIAQRDWRVRRVAALVTGT